MIDFIRNFIGIVPEIHSVYDLPALLEYCFGVFLLFLVVVSAYAVFGSIIKLFRR